VKFLSSYERRAGIVFASLLAFQFMICIRLPTAAEWPVLLPSAGLRLICAEDRDDLFLVKAQSANGHRTEG
jgi:hypothetical protein